MSGAISWPYLEIRRAERSLQSHREPHKRRPDNKSHAEFHLVRVDSELTSWSTVPAQCPAQTKTGTPFLRSGGLRRLRADYSRRDGVRYSDSCAGGRVNCGRRTRECVWDDTEIRGIDSLARLGGYEVQSTI